ncbi:hypothetical protein HOS87_gp05 [Pseudomonas phage phiNV3]|uniref:Uncharacterized protein n=1 Tax=Pseudomonas phage phiNV3 TaxID=2079544 RepID=A0A2P0ZLJ1_9CAUD|nr:hypothetical protein [Pseudomonas tolaasii]YP_009798985.1 hypothetical protein HOS87_gp05 [Pseudomonas phage phiNV3]ARB30328.1 hypothetical protein B5P22_24580 [Pseudomonas tolaasii]AVH86115.1 hypothetical protein phiNV3_p05 [Pseudomonas phage phiNV3]
MTKIATCIASTAGKDIVLFAIDLCHKHTIDLGSTRIGRSYTPSRGWFPFVSIVQELQSVAEQIELTCVAERLPVWHIQGEPGRGTVQQYTTGKPVYKYSDKPSGLDQVIEFNGSTIYVY